MLTQTSVYERITNHLRSDFLLKHCSIVTQTHKTSVLGHGAGIQPGQRRNWFRVSPCWSYGGHLNGWLYCPQHTIGSFAFGQD